MAAPAANEDRHAGRDPPAADRGVADLFAEVVKEFSNLLRKEMQLARTELSEKVTLVALSVGLIVAGAVLVMAALILLLQAGVAALVAQGFSTTIATLFVAGAALIVGLGILWFGASRLQAKNLAPARTLDALQQDAAVAKYQVSPQ
jgi:Putative Actinobacterial Holin-X, holin superfamily III